MTIGDITTSQGKFGIGIAQRLTALTVQPQALFSLTGTVAKSNASDTLTGTATLFLSEIGIGDRIEVPGGPQRHALLLQ